MAAKGYMTVANTLALNAIVEEMIESVILEAVSHFLKKKPIKKAQIADDPRYFYNKQELNTFFTLYNAKKAETNSDALLVETLLDDNHEFLCYKVYR